MPGGSYNPTMGATATLRQIDQRISEIDDLVFRGNTGQMPMTVEGRGRLEAEATSLMEILAKALQENGAGQYQELYDARKKVRELTLVSAVSARYEKLHPEPQPEIDAVTTPGPKRFSKSPYGSGPSCIAGV